ncbi:MAG: T9SS type A sorting domain-containing protein [Flavobacteriales bacterium]|nr:T9SS type A sorting domain-containing protein [Flavobacteriales bacterium]MCB9164483.1 T9SS type A sorting domain-containing protein [Flavobacteriales bacterium]
MRVLHFLLMAGAFNAASACSCFGPDTFCGVLNPPYPQPEWWLPDAVVMVVPVLHEHYGMDVAILQVFQGEVNADTVRVWGDNGALCRLYTGWAIGDTIILGLQQCDLAGNSILNPEYPPDLESPEDYMVSVCGVYMLDYAGGMVYGRIDTPLEQAMTVEAFAGTIGLCALANALPEEPTIDHLVVQTGDEGISLEWRGSSAPSELTLFDAQGRAVWDRRWVGGPTVIQNIPPGVYLIQVDTGVGRLVRRVVIGQ